MTNYSVVFDAGTPNTLSDGNVADDLNQFSISMWFKFPPGHGGDNECLFTKWDDGAFRGYLSLFSINGGSVRPTVLVATDFSNYIQSTAQSPDLDDNQWHQFVYTFDRTLQEPHIYIDKIEGTTNATGGTVTSYSTAVNVQIGKSDAGNYPLGTPTPANIAAFRVYNVVLSQSDVNSLYNNVDPQPSARVIDWELTEGSGFTTADSSGNGNTGTLGANLTWSSDIPPSFGGSSAKKKASSFLLFD